MKTDLRKLIAPESNKLIAIHLLREYLQARILQSLQRAGAMRTLAFHGGTSLRFLYDIPRYSEDLDFALDLLPEEYDFQAYLHAIKRDLSAEAYTVDVKLNQKRVVHKAFVRFRGLLYEMGLSGHKTEVIAIKLEVDTNPPPHAGLMTTALQKYVALDIHHHDPATLFAGKIGAVLQRVYLKGRDIYDLWWYLSQSNWPQPNFVYLNHSLQQSGWSDPPVTETNWRSILYQRMQGIDWALVLEDVGSFIIAIDQQTDFNKQRLLELLDEDI